MFKRALISVYKKDGILEFAKWLDGLGTKIISTGGTYKYLELSGISPVEVSQVTGAPEMLDGRVKTLHPKIHGGILAIRSNDEHMKTIEREDIDTIDIVVVNLYPFFEEAKSNKTFEEKIEFIDIGGPSMLRSAAKSFQDVVVICDSSDYQVVMNEYNETGNISIATRKYLAGKVFNLTSSYDAAISQFLLEDKFTPYLSLSYQKAMELRYGENPHQKAAYYTATSGKGAMNGFEQLNGKELSFNNIRDMDIAWKIVNEFENPVVCAIKHSTPCGVAVGGDIYEAWEKAYSCDSVSIFGGIVACNRTVDEKTANEMIKIFLEIVIAPDYTKEALEVLREKKNLRIIKTKMGIEDEIEVIPVDGGILVQNRDSEFSSELKTVTENSPTSDEMKNLIFAQKVVKHVKSNAIVVAKDMMAKGIGTGQVNRIWAAKEAIERAGDGTVLASDAFFPFPDVVEECAKSGIKAIIQPGGSINDNASIEACNKHKIAMVFTNMRHFKH